MMVTATVIGLSTGNRLLSSSFCPPDLADKLFPIADGPLQISTSPTKSIIVAQKSSHFGSNASTSRDTQAVRAPKECVGTSAPSIIDGWFPRANLLQNVDSGFESSLDVLVLLQKSMLEKQYELPFTQMTTISAPGETSTQGITHSGVSARQRRTSTRSRCFNQKASPTTSRNMKQFRSSISPELLNMKVSGYMRGSVSENLLSHAEVVNLSNKIRIGLSLEEHKTKLKEKLGCEPFEKQLASSLRISHAELHSKLMECSLAREKLTMSNVRLVISIAQKYENLGAEMADLVQGGLIGLLRGIEKFDSSMGFRISTYVYWWIHQRQLEPLQGSRGR